MILLSSGLLVYELDSSFRKKKKKVVFISWSQVYLTLNNY